MLDIASEAGVCTIVVTSQDAAGNFMADTATFVFDKDQPQVKIVTPAQNAQFNAGPIAVTGTASDTTGSVSKVYVRVYVPDTDFGQVRKRQSDSVVTGAGSWLGTVNFAQLGDTLGDWHIVAYAVDAAGNTGPVSDTLVIRYDTGVTDVTSPQISDAVVDPGVFGASGANVKYVLNESVDTSYVLIRTSGGVFVDTEPGGGVAQSAGQNLIVWDGKDYLGNLVIDDTYTFEINVTDRSGNKTKVTVTGIKDEVAPVVTITQPRCRPSPATPGRTTRRRFGTRRWRGDEPSGDIREVERHAGEGVYDGDGRCDRHDCDVGRQERRRR